MPAPLLRAAPAARAHQRPGRTGRRCCADRGRVLEELRQTEPRRSTGCSLLWLLALARDRRLGPARAAAATARAARPHRIDPGPRCRAPARLAALAPSVVAVIPHPSACGRGTHTNLQERLVQRWTVTPRHDSRLRSPGLRLCWLLSSLRRRRSSASGPPSPRPRRPEPGRSLDSDVVLGMGIRSRS